MSEEATKQVIQDAAVERKTFHLEVTTKDKVWKGDFIFRRPTIAEVGRIGVLTARRNNDLANIPPEAALFNSMLAHCDVVMEKCPDWFKDYEKFTVKKVVYDLYTQLSEWLRED